MLPSTDLWLRTPGATSTLTDPPTLLLLHFYGGSRREWIEAGIALARSFRVISFDTPGFGEAADVPGYTVTEMADTFEAAIRELNPGRFVLVGHSMTGKVAAVLAKRGIPGLEKLVLLTPSPVCPEPVAPEDRETMLAQAVPTRKDAEGYVLGNSTRPLAPEVLERAIEDRMRANPDAWRAWMEHGSKEDWSERIGSLGLPTLVIAAEKDKSLGPAVQRQMTMPHFLDVRLEVIPDCGHLVPMEAPRELSVLIREFAGKPA